MTRRRYINGYYSVTPRPAAQKRAALMSGSFHYTGLGLCMNGCSEEMHQGNAPGKCTREMHQGNAPWRVLMPSKILPQCRLTAPVGEKNKGPSDSFLSSSLNKMLKKKKKL